jgi:hypothetical protein
MSAPQMFLRILTVLLGGPNYGQNSLCYSPTESDPKYSERAKDIGELISDPHFPKIHQIYFVPK